MRRDLNVYRELRAPDVENLPTSASVVPRDAHDEMPADTDFDVNRYAASVKVLAVK